MQKAFMPTSMFGGATNANPKRAQDELIKAGA